MFKILRDIFFCFQFFTVHDDCTCTSYCKNDIFKILDPYCISQQRYNCKYVLLDDQLLKRSRVCMLELMMSFVTVALECLLL